MSYLSECLFDIPVTFRKQKKLGRLRCANVNENCEREIISNLKRSNLQRRGCAEPLKQRASSLFESYTIHKKASSLLECGRIVCPCIFKQNAL